METTRREKWRACTRGRMRRKDESQRKEEGTRGGREGGGIGREFEESGVRASYFNILSALRGITHTTSGRPIFETDHKRGGARPRVPGNGKTNEPGPSARKHLTKITTRVTIGSPCRFTSPRITRNFDIEIRREIRISFATLYHLLWIRALD